MTTEVMIAIDLAAIFILTIALYYRRHRRRQTWSPPSRC